VKKVIVAALMILAVFSGSVSAQNII